MRVNQRKLDEALGVVNNIISWLQSGQQVLDTVWDAQEDSIPVNAELLKRAQAWSRLAPKIEDYISRTKDWHTIEESHEADVEVMPMVNALRNEIVKARRTWTID